MSYDINRVIIGDVREIAKTLPDCSVNCIVTSPPYWGLRDYGTAEWVGGDVNCDHSPKRKNGYESSTLGGNRNNNNHSKEGFKGDICPKCGAIRKDNQIGLESTPQEHVAIMVDVFRELRRVLRDDGTLWLNIGDTYSGGGRGGNGDNITGRGKNASQLSHRSFPDIPSKNLIGIPWRIALALQDDGWYLRSDIIWSKTNPMPESVTDRPTKSHEYIFLLAKSERYYYDADAIREPKALSTILDPRTNGNGHRRDRDYPGQPNNGGTNLGGPDGYRNKRTVWTVSTKPFSGAKLLADYVGDDGKPYKLSPDCPIHSHHRNYQNQHTGEYDEQPNHFVIHNPGIDDCPDLESSCEPESKISHKTLAFGDENSHVHNPENIDGSKTSSSHLEYMLDEQMIYHTEGNHIQYANQDYKKDYSPEQYSEIAKLHNNQMNKIDLSLRTSENDNISVQNTDHKSNTGQLPLSYLQDHDIGENKISVVYSGDNQNSQSHDGNSGSSQQQVFFGAQSSSIDKDTPLYCTCEVVSIDHFATFPPDLIKPCILAGCPEGGIVLDPFMGSGTVAQVAIELRRNWLGIELNPEYVELTQRRIASLQPMLIPEL